jgi:eukaryotic-like serine/threonine-protein kinase
MRVHGDAAGSQAGLHGATFVLVVGEPSRPVTMCRRATVAIVVVAADRCCSIEMRVMDAMLGQYRVTGTIGHGGMGVVHVAEHTLLGRRAAIKVLRSELSQNQNAVTRFFNEARALAAIHHPGIVDVYDFGWTPDGAAFLVMEHLEGESLTRRSARSPFRWPAALAIARQIAGALAAAHAKGIVHRDLKPDNVFLVPDPEVPGGERIKLLDFGIAKLAATSSTPHSLTRTGVVIGTPTYMAPEQCRGVAVDHRADLYALGCVIYELCCGRPPFVGEGSGDVLVAHITMPAPAMSNTNPEIPQLVETLVRRLLAKAPGDRLQTADRVILAIDALLSERPSATAPSQSDAPAATGLAITGSAMTTLSGSVEMTALQQRTARLRWSIAASAAFVVVVAIAIATLGMHRDDDAATAVPAAAGPPQTAALAVAVRPDEPRDAPARLVAQTPAPPAVQTPRDEPPAPPAEPAEPPALVEIVVDSAPSGAEVLLGGTVQGTTPFVGRLPRDDRDVKLGIRHAGYIDRTILVHPTAPIRERVTLTRKPAVAVPKPSTPERDRSFNPFD